MVKEFSKRATLVRSSGLCPINSIEGLVKEQSDRPAQVYPGRTVRVKSGIVVQHSQEIDNDEAEAA